MVEFNNVINKLIINNELYFLTESINEVCIKNKGILKNLNCKFTKGLNIINGPGGSGKSTIIKYLIETNNKLLTKDLSKTKTIIIDSHSDAIYSNDIKEFVTYLNKKFNRPQIILTICMPVFDRLLKENVIKSDNTINISK